MGKFFSRERFGKPQVLAGLRLLVFVAECAWLVAHTAPNLHSPDDFSRVHVRVVRCSALWLVAPDIAGACGPFGALCSAIALPHALYAPREVVLCNWRRIVLLGLSLALAVGSQF